MPRGQRNTETPVAKPARKTQTNEERALDAVVKAFEKYDATQDRALESAKRTEELWNETKYLKKVFLHAGSHPDLPDDFDAEQYIADRTGQEPEGDVNEEIVEPQADVADVEVVTQTTPEGRTDVVDVQPPAADEDDPFANIG